MHTTIFDRMGCIPVRADAGGNFLIGKQDLAC